MTAGWAGIVPDHRPRFPADRPGVAVLGAGRIAQSAHLPAYAAHGVDVVGVWSRTPATTAGIRDRFPGIGTVYSSAEEALSDPRVGIVDLATAPDVRPPLLAAAVRAGKHVLVQKPLATDAAQLDALGDVLTEAADRGVLVAVNQNARWAPVWRAATLLVRDGAIGDVVGVTHLHDKPLPPLAGTPFDDVPHMLLADYLVHWVDITACWLAGTDVTTVSAHDSRVPGQPAGARNPWHATVHLSCADGASAALRVVGDARAATPGCPFWVHGTDGTLRGSILGGSDRLSLDRGTTTTSYALEGQWFVDGFAGAMGELMCAVAEDRQPGNSAAHNAATLRIVVAARDSAEAGGTVVPTPGLQL